MIDWTLTQPFYNHILTPVAGDDSVFGATLQKLAALPPDQIINKRLNIIVRRLLAHHGSASARQQACFWYLAGTCYLAHHAYARAFEAFAQSLKKFDGAAQPDWLIRANLTFALATVGQYTPHSILALSYCDAAIQAVQTPAVQNFPGLSRQDWESALESARALRAILAASKHGSFAPLYGIIPPEYR